MTMGVDSHTGLSGGCGAHGDLEEDDIEEEAAAAVAVVLIMVAAADVSLSGLTATAAINDDLDSFMIATSLLTGDEGVIGSGLNDMRGNKGLTVDDKTVGMGVGGRGNGSDKGRGSRVLLALGLCSLAVVVVVVVDWAN